MLQPEALDYIADNETVFEREPLIQLAKYGELMGYRHREFRHPMDSLRDKPIGTVCGRGRMPWMTDS